MGSRDPWLLPPLWSVAKYVTFLASVSPSVKWKYYPSHGAVMKVNNNYCSFISSLRINWNQTITSHCLSSPLRQNTCPKKKVIFTVFCFRFLNIFNFITPSHLSSSGATVFCFMACNRQGTKQVREKEVYLPHPDPSPCPHQDTESTRRAHKSYGLRLSSPINCCLPVMG